MKKYAKIITGAVSTIALCISASGCSFGGNESSAADMQTSRTSSATSDMQTSEDMDTSQPSDSDMADNGIGNGNMTVAERVREAIAKAYGDNYLPNMEIPADLLESEFGLTPDMYDEIVAEMPTIGFHPDRLIIVKPKENKEDEVENALKKAKTTLAEGAAQYPQNLAKVSAARVLEEDGYYCFMLLGEPDSSGENDDAAIEFATKQIEIGVNAFEAFFEKI